MQVLVGAVWHVVVHNDVDTLHVDASAEYIRAHHDAALESLELLKPLNSVFLGNSRVNHHRGE